MKNLNKARYGKQNGMYGVKRFGKDNPNFGHGENISGKKNPMKRNDVKLIHKFSVNTKEYKKIQSFNSLKMWEELRKNEDKLKKRNQKLSNSLKGIEFSDEHKKKLRKYWKDRGCGIGKHYPSNFKLKRKIIQISNLSCLLCGNNEDIVIHHWDLNKLNSDWCNLFILCRHCHTKIHHKRGKKNEGTKR